MTEEITLSAPLPETGAPHPPAPNEELHVSKKLTDNSEILDANARAVSAFLGEQERQAKLQAQIDASDKVLAAQCSFLLNSVLGLARILAGGFKTQVAV